MGRRRHTNRRTWLGLCAGTAGATILAGCSSDEETTDDTDDTGTSDDGLLEFGSDSDGDWPMFGADLQNTGYQPDGDGPVDDVTVRWRLEGGDRFVSSPAIVDGIVYAGCRDGYLYAVDAETGEIEWATQLNQRVSSPPTVIDGVVYVSSHGVPDKIHALEADSGEQLWAEELGNSAHSPAPYGDVIYTYHSGWLIETDRTSGTSSVLFEGYSQTPTAPAIKDGVLFGGGRRSIVAHDLEQMERKWEFENENTEHMSNGTPAVVDGTLYTGSTDSKLYALDVESGEEKWTFETDDSISAGPSVADDTIYLPSRDGHVYAIDANSREQKWSVDYEFQLQQKPAVTESMIYFIDGKTLHGLDRSDGGVHWSFTPDKDETIGGTLSVADRVAYLPSRDHHLYALEEA
ncbi:outer membrane protein assembly factor BamB family protein [Natrarchaeobius chitinivorans]|uniref:Pyrrolo-quinoline quinone repeat domain-containing protein n=1 Tax=Natrarchaeobius chitinivorans TaxID=1679083 RepID=A0A3N6MHX4_NATCH|nr:PQQ-binding-like beta-propeller repeat protein [Natrarchaeobius chitinivorans]RQG96540.1 hypothetical protein EA473_05355 [Natrarchaeobius chitinivorans]